MAQASNEEHAVEVMEKAKRRQYSAAYKLKILQAADACTKPGEEAKEDEAEPLAQVEDKTHAARCRGQGRSAKRARKAAETPMR